MRKFFSGVVGEDGKRRFHAENAVVVGGKSFVANASTTNNGVSVTLRAVDTGETTHFPFAEKMKAQLCYPSRSSASSVMLMSSFDKHVHHRRVTFLVSSEGKITASDKLLHSFSVESGAWFTRWSGGLLCYDHPYILDIREDGERRELYRFQTGAETRGGRTYLCGTHLSRTILIRTDNEDGKGSTRLWKMHFDGDGVLSRQLVHETEYLRGFTLSELL